MYSVNFHRYVQGTQIWASQGLAQCNKVISESIPLGEAFVWDIGSWVWGWEQILQSFLAPGNLYYYLTLFSDLQINLLWCYFFEINIFFGVDFLYCRHKSLSCLKKTCASLSFPTITRGKMEQWSSEGLSTMCLAVPSPFLQGARMWFTIPREYVCLHLTTTELGT